MSRADGADGRGAGLQADFAAALVDPARPAPPALRVWNGSDPVARLAVYRNNRVAALVDALDASFPVVRELVGQAFFRALAAAFVRHAPPRSPVLALYGTGFAEFIEGFEAARGVPYLADVARLETARLRALHAADAPTLDAAAAAPVLGDPSRAAELRLVCHPATAALRSRHAMVSLWAAHQGLADIEAVDPDRPEAALVLRQQDSVSVIACAHAAAAFVDALLAGDAFGDAAAAGAACDAGFDLAATLTLLLARGALTSIHLP